MDEPNDPLPAPTRDLPADAVAADKLAVVADLAPGLLHELNNALAGIAGFGHVLRGDPSLPDAVRDQAGQAVAETERARRLIQGLLEFVRHRPRERHPTSIPALIGSVVDLEASTIAAKGVHVVVDVPPDLPPVPLDRPAIQHVLLAITALALDGAERGSRVRIAANGENGVLRVSVTGGAAQLDDRSHPRLAVATQIVALQGGRLWREPAGPGIVVELPTDNLTPREDPRPAAAGDGRRLDRPCVLVIDDSPSIRQFLDRVLARAGCDAVLAADAAEGLELIRDRPFDAVLSDQRIGPMLGVDVYTAAVALRPELATRFALMSGDVLEPSLRAFVDEHEMALLEKPFDLETVHRTVEELIGTMAGARASDAPDPNDRPQPRG